MDHQGGYIWVIPAFQTGKMNIEFKGLEGIVFNIFVIKRNRAGEKGSLMSDIIKHFFFDLRTRQANGKSEIFLDIILSIRWN